MSSTVRQKSQRPNTREGDEQITRRTREFWMMSIIKLRKKRARRKKKKKKATAVIVLPVKVPVGPHEGTANRFLGNRTSV